MAELELREIGIDDLDAIFTLSSACDIADTGEVDLERADLVASLSSDGTRAWALVANDGSYQALTWHEPHEGGPSQVAEFFVHPSQDVAVGAPIVETMLAAQRDDPLRRKLHVMVSANAPTRSALLREHGATIVRHFYKMSIDLDTATTSAAWPDGVTLHAVTDTDADLEPVHATISEAFEDHWDHGSQDFDTWQKRHRSREDFDPSLWWLVRVDGEPAAATICAVRDSGGFVASLGVRRPYRGNGLAKRLLATAFATFKERGVEQSSLFVDSDSPTGAVRLYESVGMTVAAQWDCHEFRVGD